MHAVYHVALIFIISMWRNLKCKKKQETTGGYVFTSVRLFTGRGYPLLCPTQPTPASRQDRGTLHPWRTPSQDLTRPVFCTEYGYLYVPGDRQSYGYKRKKN